MWTQKRRLLIPDLVNATFFVQRVFADAVKDLEMKGSPRIIHGGPNPVTSVLWEEGRVRFEMDRREGNVTREVTESEVKGCQLSPLEAKNRFSPGASRRTRFLLMVLDFLPSEPRGDTFLLLEVT